MKLVFQPSHEAERAGEQVGRGWEHVSPNNPSTFSEGTWTLQTYITVPSEKVLGSLGEVLKTLGRRGEEA